MGNFNYNRAVFAFNESELWDNIIYILEQNAEAEVNNAIRMSTNGESRIHACGRAEALKDILSAIIDERKQALEEAKRDII